MTDFMITSLWGATDLFFKCLENDISFVAFIIFLGCIFTFIHLSPKH